MRGAQVLTPEMDVYAFAICCAEILTKGALPWPLMDDDAVRHFVPEPEKLFSWWSYRSPDWQQNDRGRRLDHVWTTPTLQPRLKAAKILRPMRSWDQPSDHVAVIVDID